MGEVFCTIELGDDEVYNSELVQAHLEQGWEYICSTVAIDGRRTAELRGKVSELR